RKSDEIESSIDVNQIKSMRTALNHSPDCRAAACCNHSGFAGDTSATTGYCTSHSLLRGNRSDNCLKARVAAQRVPELIEAQLAISNLASRQLRCFSQSLDGAILLARPRINDGQVLDQHRPLDGAFADGHQLDGALAFANCILPISQSRIDHTERAESRSIIGMVAQ